MAKFFEQLSWNFLDMFYCPFLREKGWKSSVCPTPETANEILVDLGLWTEIIWFSIFRSSKIRCAIVLYCKCPTWQARRAWSLTFTGGGAIYSGGLGLHSLSWSPKITVNRRLDCLCEFIYAPGILRFYAPWGSEFSKFDYVCFKA